jgi:hypothetical protein
MRPASDTARRDVSPLLGEGSLEQAGDPADREGDKPRGMGVLWGFSRNGPSERGILSLPGVLEFGSRGPE